MALWHSLIGCCFSAAIGGALVPPRVSHAGTLGYALAVSVGVIVGFACGWLMWIMHKEFVSWVRNRADVGRMSSNWLLRTFYFSKVLWLVVTILVGFQASLALQQLVR